MPGCACAAAPKAPPVWPKAPAGSRQMGLFLLGRAERQTSSSPERRGSRGGRAEQTRRVGRLRRAEGARRRRPEGARRLPEASRRRWRAKQTAGRGRRRAERRLGRGAEGARLSRSRPASGASQKQARSSGRTRSSAAAAGSRRRRSSSSTPQTSAGSACRRRRTTWRLAFASAALCAIRRARAVVKSRARARFNKAERPAGAASVFSRGAPALQRKLASRLPGVLWCAGAPRNVYYARALCRLSKTAGAAASGL